jgi:hypothetical protein
MDDDVLGRRAGRSPMRPLANTLTGSLAASFDGILTRNENDSRQLFSEAA